MENKSGKRAEISGLSVSSIILRPFLMQAIKKKTAKKNIFITAPGGYGKTVAVTQWLSSVQGGTARLIIGDADNDPNHFYTRLAFALLGLVGKRKFKNTLPVSGLSLDDLLGALRFLPQKNALCYLALDDMHILKNEEVINSLPLIINRLPVYLRLCLISRSEPPAPLLQTGRFEILTKDDILFTKEETEWLCAERALNLTSEQITEIHATTGGWAMYLSASLSGVDTPDEDDKKPRTLMQYLETRVWSLWDRETKLLLLHLAVPTEITTGLCERLTGEVDGRSILERLIKKENAFLSRTGEDSYRYHDLFRDFLLARLSDYLGEDETKRLHVIAAEWYYGQGDYFASAQHYIYNKDHDGVSRCMKETNRFHEKSGNLSVEVSLNFTRQYVMNLPPEFITENPYLISECAVVAFHNGDAGEFLRYTDILYEMLPEIAAKHPDLAESVGFIGGLDFRVSLKEYACQVAEMMSLMPETEDEAHSNTITQNLPFFHRSMRDFSEYYDLLEDEVKLLRDTFGVMIGKDYTVMETSLVAGIYYERGDLIEALRHSLNGYHICEEHMQPETIFSAYMIFAAVLFAMGAARDANRIMKQAEEFVGQERARFLHSNFKALQTERAIRDGSKDAAKEWLAVYANRTGHLPFYQMCRHFTTLRSYIAVKEYENAANFGKRLQELSTQYCRPLDQIESGLLTAIALWHYDDQVNKNKAIRQLEQAINIAIPYGFIQLFLSEGREIIPILWELQKRTGKTSAFMSFINKLIEEIYGLHCALDASAEQPNLTKNQLAILSYLNTGMSYNEIADKMGIGHGTVKGHVLRLYKRIGAHNAQEAIAKAKMLGIMENVFTVFLESFGGFTSR